MKSASLFISILLLAYNIHAQRYAISNEKMNIVYVDIDNPIHVMVEGLPANKLKVTTENGTIHPIRAGFAPQHARRVGLARGL